MLGYIYFNFKRFVLQKKGIIYWDRLAEKIQLPPEMHFENHEAYPDKEMIEMMGALATDCNQPISQVEEEFGFFMAPHLNSISGYMIPKDWGLMELLLHIQTGIHKRLSKSLTASTTPFLEIKQDGPRSLIIAYNSPRKMCYFARGILNGLSHLYQEPIKIEKRLCMHNGDPQCIFHIQLL